MYGVSELPVRNFVQNIINMPFTDHQTVPLNELDPCRCPVSYIDENGYIFL